MDKPKRPLSTKGSSRTLLELAEAYAIQTHTIGGLKLSLNRKWGTKPITNSGGVVEPKARKSRQLSTGSKLSRQWNGRTQHVDVVQGGYVWMSSMGRLTLNVLLSFAQLEREVIAERIRDKVAASKSKGMWIVGPAPIGPIVEEKKLIIDPIVAETVRQIYDQYAAYGSIRKLTEHLDHVGLLTKHRLRKDGTLTGGKPFSRGHLQWILTNPIYAGLMTH